MSTHQRFDTSRFAAVFHAEFLKIWASRIPLVILLALPALTYLFVFELYHVERVTEHMSITNLLDTMPIVFFAMWKTVLFQATMLTFSAFWMTVDSQYGMIRVGCCQPVSRVEYLLGKWCGITAHVAIVTVGFALVQIIWTGLYSGLRGVGTRGVVSLAMFTLELTVLMVAVSSVTMAAASFRRTVGSGIVTALLAFIVLAIMTMMPFRVVAPRFILFRFFSFPLGEFPNPYPTALDSPFNRAYSMVDFFRVAIATPLLFLVPAVLYFRKRDIVE
jgi:ABC-type transport system involved in multi-copper enzyme maturation permease subunit